MKINILHKLMITDNDKNQITLFHPGAMNEAHLEFKPQKST